MIILYIIFSETVHEHREHLNLNCKLLRLSISLLNLECKIYSEDNFYGYVTLFAYGTSPTENAYALLTWRILE
jgi:hypothetical protein